MQTFIAIELETSPEDDSCFPPFGVCFCVCVWWCCTVCVDVCVCCCVVVLIISHSFVYSKALDAGHVEVHLSSLLPEHSVFSALSVCMSHTHTHTHTETHRTVTHTPP